MSLPRIYQVLDQLATAAPRHLREEIERELLPSLYVQIQQDAKRAALPCAYWPGAEPATWCVGDPAGPLLVPGGRAQAALRAVWLAISGAAPAWHEVATCERSARRMPAVAERWARRYCPELAPAFARVRATGGRLRYSPGGFVRVLFASGNAANDAHGPTIATPITQESRP